LAQTALMAPGPEVTQLRALLGELFAIPDAQKHMAELLAGSDVRYDVGDDHPLSGRLVPDLTFDDGRRVSELLHDARPILLDLDGSVAPAVRGWADRVDVVVAGMADRPAEPSPKAMLIRPDGYVAWATDTFGPAAETSLHQALKRWFGPAPRGK
ncbi:MAG: FAD-dependent oxidoreductase, partial [Mycobacterium sp.]|nr:FAD-dependent oxidoreductase [Mycobacterium sp.]